MERKKKIRWEKLQFLELRDILIVTVLGIEESCV